MSIQYGECSIFSWNMINKYHKRSLDYNELLKKNKCQDCCPDGKWINYACMICGRYAKYLKISDNVILCNDDECIKQLDKLAKSCNTNYDIDTYEKPQYSLEYFCCSSSHLPFEFKYKYCNLCKCKILTDKLEHHQEHDCGMLKKQCPYCNVVILQKNYFSHIYRKHIHKYHITYDASYECIHCNDFITKNSNKDEYKYHIYGNCCD